MKMRKLGITPLLLVTLCNCWWSFPVAESASGNQVLANGTIVFAPLPTNQEDFVPATYDAKGLDGYYAMSNGFTDVVRSGTLPYDIIIPLIQNLRTDPANVNQESYTNMLLQWYAPILALTILGVIFAMCMPLCCIVTCCCRCCNQCGADLTSSIDDEGKEGSRRVACWVELIIVVLLSILVGVGMVFAFLTNQAIKDTIDNIVPTFNNAVDNVESFANSSVSELTFLNNQFGFAIDAVVNQTDLQASVVDPLLNMHLPAFDRLLAEINNLGDDFQSVNSSLASVTSNITALNATAQNISDQLAVLRANLTRLNMTCFADLSSLPAAMPMPCMTIPDPGSIPDVNAGLDEVGSALDVVNMFEGSLSFADNLTMIVNQINETFRNAINNITSTAENQTQVVADSVTPIRNNINSSLNSFTPLITQFFRGEPDGNLSFTVQSVRDFISQQVTDQDLPHSLSNLSLARWLIGLFFCIIVLLTLLAIAGGLFCGLAGSRRHRLPYERTRLSNCGGVSLLASVYLIFLTCFVLFILAAILFPFGTTWRKICQAVENPQYEVFERIVDNEDIWGGTTLVNSLIPSDVGGGNSINVNLSVQSVFQMCEMNQPLWQALQADQIIMGVNIDISGQRVNLGSLVNNPRSLLDVFNLTDLIASATAGIGNLTIDGSSLIPSDLVDSLRSSLPNVTDLDFRASLLATVNSSLVNASMALKDASAQLADFTQMLNASNLTMQAMAINNTIQTIQGLIQVAMTQLGELDMSTAAAQSAAQAALDSALMQINATQDEVLVLVANVTDSIPVVIEAFVDDTIGTVEQFVSYTANTLRSDALRCGPLSNVYVGAINLVCRQNLNSLNGFWFALGWCALFFLPLAILLIVLSKHFRQHKDVDEILRGNEEYPEYQLETYYNLPAASQAIANSSPQMGTQGHFTKNLDGYPTMFDDPRNGHDDLWVGNTVNLDL